MKKNVDEKQEEINKNLCADKENIESKQTKTEKDEDVNVDETSSDNNLTENEEVNTEDTNNNLDDIDQINELKAKIKDKDEELSKIKNLLLRRQADFENFKKRSIKDAELNKKLVIKNISLDIMDLHDNLLRASDAASNISQGDSLEKAHEAFVEGVNMISRNIELVLEKYGIEEIEAINIPFNPEYHEAVEFDMSDDVDSDTVTRVHQKGFKLDDFVIRTSKVKVTKPMPNQESTENSENEASEE